MSSKKSIDCRRRITSAAQCRLAAWNNGLIIADNVRLSARRRVAGDLPRGGVCRSFSLFGHRLAGRESARVEISRKLRFVL